MTDPRSRPASATEEVGGRGAAGAAAVAVIRDMILGGQDGLVNVLGLVLGLAVAIGDSRVIVTAALAAMCAEAIAMAGVAYTSRGAERDYATDARIRRAEQLTSEAEQRLAALRAEMAGESHRTLELDLLIGAVREEAEAWRSGIAEFEREMAPIREAHPARAALVVGVSTLAGSAVPLVPFLLLPVATAAPVAVLAAAVALFVAGLERARLTGGTPIRAGVEMIAIGLLSALAGYLIGRALRAPAA